MQAEFFFNDLPRCNHESYQGSFFDEYAIVSVRLLYLKKNFIPLFGAATYYNFQIVYKYILYFAPYILNNSGVYMKNTNMLKGTYIRLLLYKLLLKKKYFILIHTNI